MHRPLLVGWAKIASGNAAAAVLRLIGLVIAAHSLEVATLGIVVLIEAYVRFVDGLLNFQSVNVITKFLAETDHRRDPLRFTGLIKVGLLVDAATAFATCALAIGLLPFTAALTGIPDQWTSLAMLFCVVILSRILGTPEAVFRCFDRFWAIGHRETVNGALLVLASLVAWWLNAGATAFLLIWLGSEAIANLLFLGWMFIVLRQHGLRSLWRSDARAAIRQSPMFWAMLWQTNVSSGIRTLSQYGDILVAGAVLGPTAAGLLRAAKNIAALVGLFGRPLQQVASAPIARMWADGQKRALFVYVRNMSVAAGLAGLAFTALFAVFGESVLSLLFGSEFAAAGTVLTILMFANAIYLAGVALLPTTLTLWLNAQFLFGIILGTIAYAAVLGGGVAIYGNLGIAAAHVAFNVVWAVYCWSFVARRLRMP